MPEILDIASLPSLSDVGFTAGRDGLREFCRRIFDAPVPRFLKNENNQLVVFRNADLRAFGAAPEIGNVPIGTLFPSRYMETDDPQEKLPGWEIGEVIGKQVFTFNPPLHGPARRILTSWLSPKGVNLMEGVARKIVNQIIRETADGEEIDFVKEVAERLILGFWSELLHLTESESQSLGQHARNMTRLFYVDRTDDDLRALDVAFSGYAQILAGAAERGLAEGDPIMLEIAEKLKDLDFQDDPFETGVVPKSVGDFLAGNLIDGVHTAALAAANTVFALASTPNAMELVRQTPELVPRAIAEALRLNPPVLFLPRFSLRDFHYDDLIIPAGNMISMMWGAGNYDPATFADPEVFNPNRPPAGLTTFGGGIHICPGRYVGVMLVRVMIEEFEANGVICEPGNNPAVWYPSHKLSQLKVFPVRLRKDAPQTV
ncbi:cytochrome P450 [Martelella soudanensis]|uniref:cytochrome P450 n=1 Tax=unclassified Martelella TaxID=2629616 RepID=UPI0015DFFF45|nr:MULTISPECIES: cytochrome P450 [unclassified Martelella]